MKKLIFYCLFFILSAASQAKPSLDPNRWKWITESYDGTMSVFIDTQTITDNSAWFILNDAIDASGNKTAVIGQVFFRCGQRKISFGRQSVIDVATGRAVKVELGDPNYFVDVFPYSVQENIYKYFCSNYYQ